MSRPAPTPALARAGSLGPGLGLACAVLLLSEGAAEAESSTLLRLEATLGAGWRTSIDQNDRNPSFDALMAQAEVAVGPGCRVIQLQQTSDGQQHIGTGRQQVKGEEQLHEGPRLNGLRKGARPVEVSLGAAARLWRGSIIKTRSRHGHDAD
jgi:hypothetical protein